MAPPSSAQDVALSPSSGVEEPSRPTLDELGVEAALGAMIDQRRRASEPAAEEIDLEAFVYEEIPRSWRVPADSDAFLKAR